MHYDFSPHLAQIREFHQAFGHPVGKCLTPLRPERLLTRIGWMFEESHELAGAPTVTTQVDAICDAAYFCGGTLVEMGVTRFLFDVSAEHRAPAMIDTTPLTKSLTRHWLTLTQQETLDAQCACLREALALLITTHHRDNRVPFAPVFGFVHRANMQKLWPDGLPHYDAQHKVIKPAEWTAPEAMIDAYLDTLTSANA